MKCVWKNGIFNIDNTVLASVSIIHTCSNLSPMTLCLNKQYILDIQHLTLYYYSIRQCVCRRIVTEIKIVKVRDFIKIAVGVRKRENVITIAKYCVKEKRGAVL